MDKSKEKIDNENNEKFISIVVWLLFYLLYF